MSWHDVRDTSDRNQILDEWMTQYGSDVWNYAFSLTGRHDLADDVTQEAFLKAYRHIDSFQYKSAIRTWLLTITRNTVHDYRKSAFVRKVLLVDRVNPSQSYPSAEHEVVDQIVVEEVWENVLKLPVKLREVLVLYAHHHMSVDQIARVLGISESAVKSRLHRARQRMTHFLEGSEEIVGSQLALGK